MNPLGTRLMAEVAALPEGSPVSAKRLLHLGTPGRRGPGLVAPRATRSIAARRSGALSAPGENAIRRQDAERRRDAESARRRDGRDYCAPWRRIANRLGLTTQLPVREVYLTSGRSRRLVLGAQTVELQHAPGWQLALAGRPSGDVIRVLAWLGRKRGAKTMARLAHALSPQTVEELSGARSRLPTWMAEQVSQLVPHA